MQKDAEKQREKEQAKSQRKWCAASPQSVSQLSRQMTLEGSAHKSKLYSKASARYRDITSKISAFVATSNVANRIVECEYRV